jgi:hypothetical protein
MLEADADTLHADGFDDAFIGYGQQFSRVLAIYDRAKCIEILMKRDGMTEDEAEEFFEFNVTGSWVGEYTPVFFTPKENQDENRI